MLVQYFLGYAQLHYTLLYRQFIPQKCTRNAVRTHDQERQRQRYTKKEWKYMLIDILFFSFLSFHLHFFSFNFIKIQENQWIRKSFFYETNSMILSNYPSFLPPFFLLLSKTDLLLFASLIFAWIVHFLLFIISF